MATLSLGIRLRVITNGVPHCRDATLCLDAWRTACRPDPMPFPCPAGTFTEDENRVASKNACFDCPSARGIGGLRTTNLIDRLPAPAERWARTGHESPRTLQLANSGPSE